MALQGSLRLRQLLSQAQEERSEDTVKPSKVRCGTIAVKSREMSGRT